MLLMVVFHRIEEGPASILEMGKGYGDGGGQLHELYGSMESFWVQSSALAPALLRAMKFPTTWRELKMVECALTQIQQHR